jgi:tripartite-type tricarboxylate transporter receptor subunit TctC
MRNKAMHRRRWPGLAAAALAALVATTGTSRAADTAESYYKGRDLNLVIGYSVGGGYDLYARLLSRYIGDHIPGKPLITPQSMPGAGSLKAISYLYAAAPKDGSVFGTFGRTMPVEPLLGSAAFDARKLTWLGSVTSDVSVCITWNTSQIKTFDDLISKPSNLGGQGAGSDPDVFASIIKNLFHAKLKLVTGYPGSNEAALAMERGEVDGECGVSWSTLKISHPDWIKDNKISVLIQVALEKHPDLPNVPLLLDLAKDEETRSILKVIIAGQTFARPFAAPPDLPDDRKAALRTAFDDTMKDPAFLDDAQRLGLEVRPVSWQRIDQLMSEIYATPKDVLAKAKAAVGGTM